MYSNNYQEYSTLQQCPVQGCVQTACQPEKNWQFDVTLLFGGRTSRQKEQKESIKQKQQLTFIKIFSNIVSSGRNDFRLFRRSYSKREVHPHCLGGTPYLHTNFYLPRHRLHGSPKQVVAVYKQQVMRPCFAYLDKSRCRLPCVAYKGLLLWAAWSILGGSWPVARAIGPSKYQCHQAFQEVRACSLLGGKGKCHTKTGWKVILPPFLFA